MRPSKTIETTLRSGRNPAHFRTASARTSLNQLVAVKSDVLLYCPARCCAQRRSAPAIPFPVAAGWVRAKRTGRRTIEVHKAVSLTALSPAVETVRPMLFDRAWELLRVDGWQGFVIGDQPVTLISKGRLAGQIGFGTPGVQVMMPIAPNTMLLISDRQRERVLEVKVQPWRLGRSEPWWATANRVAWLSSKRYVFAQRPWHLEAAALLLHADDRRRDITGLSAEAEEVMKQRSHERRRARRQGDAG